MWFIHKEWYANTWDLQQRFLSKGGKEGNGGMPGKSERNLKREWEQELLGNNEEWKDVGYAIEGWSESESGVIKCQFKACRGVDWVAVKSKEKEEEEDGRRKPSHPQLWGD